MAFGFLKKAVRAAGRGVKGAAKGVGSVVKTAGRGVGGISKLAGKVPIVGKGLKGVFDITTNGPFQVAANLARGQRIDKVALGALKANVAAVKDVAPYAQMVISQVPGVGQGVSGAISAGLALAEGQPVTAALAAGVKGALPGGPLAASLFSVGQAAVEGKPLDRAVIAALPIPNAQKTALVQGLGAVKSIASGKNVGSVVLDGAMNGLSKELKTALGTGIAIGEAQGLQKITPSLIKPDTMKRLAAGGSNLIRSSPMLASAGHVLDSHAREGFAVGTGLLAQPLKPIQLAAVRARLSPPQRRGFDTALAVRVGMSTKPAPKAMAPAQQLGFYTAQGIKGAGTKNKVAILKTVAKSPVVRSGAEAAVIAQGKVNSPWWRRFLEAIGVVHSPVVVR